MRKQGSRFSAPDPQLDESSNGSSSRPKRRAADAAVYTYIPFTSGPLAHFLKNRIYVGETRHKDKWFPGEHQPIIDRKTFDAVQELLRSKSADRKATRTASEAILMGKLYDDRGNRMSLSNRTEL